MTQPTLPTDCRRAGVLLHPTSLPGGEGVGDLGPDAFRFIDFLADGGFSVWQMLPLVPTHDDLSPYQGLSVHAGNPLLISLSQLQAWGWLQQPALENEHNFIQYRLNALKVAYRGFLAHATEEVRAEFLQFVEKHRAWLEDYALFQAIRQAHGGGSWLDWPTELRDREPQALQNVSEKLAEAIDYIRFEQFVFFRQWAHLREHAQQRGILLFGDMPIFVAHDSAEVWAHREYFTLNESGHADVVAGVPPDYFSDTGQRWGNPHYRWERMQQDEFQWWKSRIATQLEMFDWIRIDHFRGFEAYWEIPATEETAMHGRWINAPGDELFHSLHKQFDPLPLVAEDLGIITAEVEALRKKYKMPGMKILQFAFGGDAFNPYLPHNHRVDSVVYTGTHDNNTTLGWYKNLPPETREHLLQYLGNSSEKMPWPLIRSALASVASVAIIPMQDLLGLDGEHRMNTPGTTDENWRWRFEWSQVDAGLTSKTNQLMRLYGRAL